MTEPRSERIMWWTLFVAGGAGVLAFMLLFILMIWGIFTGAPIVPRP